MSLLATQAGACGLAYQVTACDVCFEPVTVLGCSEGLTTACCFAARVVCKAQVAKAPIAAAAASLTSLIAAHPAFALVGPAQLRLFCVLGIFPTQI